MSAVMPLFPVLEVASFIDATTIVLVGHRVDELEEHDELYVLAVGSSTIAKTNVPLIVPKAKLEITFPAGVYAVARSATVERIVTGVPDTMASLSALADIFATRTVEKRKPLNTDEKLFTGSPAKGQVQIGDPVVRAKDIAEYVKWCAQQAPSQSA